MFRLLTIAFRTIKTTDGYSFSNSQGNREWISAFFIKSTDKHIYQSVYYYTF